ncbi:MAG: AmmeMemoRadiSam system protein B [Spirochaetes bacterium]|nr:AmmeMemoRadiSam system protein B [Spirochaetota bacterium]
MVKRYYTKLIFLLLFTSCVRTSINYPFKYHFSEDPFKESSEKFNDDNTRFNFHYNSDNTLPKSGTVSHHLLVSPLIDAWFKELKKNNKEIKNFFIISPKHSQLGKGIVCISSLAWKTAGKKTIKTNKNYIDKIKKGLNLKEEPYAFHKEHGISALVPYINHYYPKALIIPIVMDEFNKQITICRKLSKIISEIMKNNDKTFLIISIDFSHKADIIHTLERDKIAESVLNSLNPDRINEMYSDNNVGLFTLFFTCNELNMKRNHIFFHIDSQSYTNRKLNDITSYFFTFQYAE